MRPELNKAQGRALHELRTIQYLEETVGPTGLRRLGAALADPELREMVQGLRRRSVGASLEIEGILEEWEAALTGRRPAPVVQPGGLGVDELLESFIEVKQDSAELLRRAVASAPTPALAERLRTLAQEEDAAAETLRLIRSRA